MFKRLFLPVLALSVAFSSCSKDDDGDNNNNSTPNANARMVNYTLDDKGCVIKAVADEDGYTVTYTVEYAD